MLWGGTTANRPNLATPSHRRSNRLTLTWNATSGSYDFTGWMEELMESKRVMADSVLLPNGKVVILNGAGVSEAWCGHNLLFAGHGMVNAIPGAGRARRRGVMTAWRGWGLGDQGLFVCGAWFGQCDP